MGCGSGSSFGAGMTTTSSSSTSCSGCAFFPLVDLVVFAFFDFAAFRPPAAFLFPLFVPVEIVDIFDAIDVVLVSIDSSRSGMSIMLGASDSDSTDTFDCVESRVDRVDNRVEAFEVRAAFEARPFFALGLFAGAVVPANTKNGHSGLRL